jgi:hypothetical protein
MSDFVFNVAKGRVPYYASLPAANDALIIVPLLTSGLQADATLKDYANLSLLLAAANDESTQLGRKTITAAATETIDNTNDWLKLALATITWTTPPAGGNISAILVCYDPDTTGGTDTSIIPLTKHDYEAQVGIGTITVEISTDGFFRAE